MLEIKDGKKILTTPISAEDLADIHIGDIIYLNGSMTTCRDVAHRRLVEGGQRTSGRCKKMLQSSMQDRSSGLLRMTSLKWYLLVRQPVCVWRNSKKNLWNRPV